MSKIIFKDLSTRKSEEIEAIGQYGLKIESYSEKVDGEEKEITKCTNQELAIENMRRLQKELFEAFLEQVEDVKEREEILNSRNLYDDFKQDVLQWATDNYIGWVIKLRLCTEHEVICDYLDENPKFSKFRKQTIQKEIKKWIDSGALDKKVLEKIEERSKKK